MTVQELKDSLIDKMKVQADMIDLDPIKAAKCQGLLEAYREIYTTLTIRGIENG